ncbi:MAG: amidase family protein [Roseobacter sp.]
MNLSPFALNRARRSSGLSIFEIALAARDDAVAHPDCFVSVCTIAEIETQVAQIQTGLDAGRALPLAGLTFCIKDNIDLTGYCSTGNCPGYGTVATETAPAVQKAMDAGAILIGKNTMDQFATGLNGTRSPDPICRNAIDPSVIPGGSSSGSGVAVAKGICDFSFGSDTGGSGRVPAAANGIVGFKPTPGLISGRGMVYCNRSFDVIPIFTNSVADAQAVFDVVGGADVLDPYAFKGPLQDVPSQTGQNYAIPSRLDHFGDEAAKVAHQENLDHLIASGARLTEIDFAPFSQAGDLVFGSALVAERLVDYGDFIAATPQAVLAPVAEAINSGLRYSARDAFTTLYKLADLKMQCLQVLEGFDALILPTIPRLFTVAEMQADPMTRNSIMGTYTYFANPLGMSAIAVPGVSRADTLPSSLCFVGLGGADNILMEQARAFEAVLSEA